MDLYVFNSHGCYIGISAAVLDPEETQKQGELIYMRPANQTEIEPPPAVVGQVAVFDIDAQVWSMQNDFRGAVYNVNEGYFEEYWLPGDLPSHLAPSAPPSNLYDWDGTAWVLNQQRELDKARAEKQQEVADLASSRCSVHMPAINSLAMIQLMEDLWPLLVSPETNPDVVAIKDIGVYAKAKYAEIASWDLATVEAYDPGTDVGFPS